MAADSLTASRMSFTAASSAPSTTAEPGAMNERILTFVMRCGTSAALPARDCAFGAKQRESAAEHFGGVEVGHRQHRSEAVPELDHGLTVHLGSATVGNRLVVAAFDLDPEIERCTGQNVAMKNGFGRERGDRSTAARNMSAARA